jgi:hypothetical protein
MHASFSSTIAGWQNFYMLAGTASATLIGLIFVAVSLHLDLIGESGAATILSVARRTFTRFIVVVIVALVFLVPRQDPEGLGLPLLALGLAETVRTVRVSRNALSAVTGYSNVDNAVNRIVLPVVLPLVSSIGMVAVAATVLADTTAYLYWMVPIVALLLTNAATNAWDLMLGLARYKLRPTGRDDASAVALNSGQGKEDRQARAP